MDPKYDAMMYSAVSCGTSLQAGSIRDGVIGTLHWHDPSSRCMALKGNEY